MKKRTLLILSTLYFLLYTFSASPVQAECVVNVPVNVNGVVNNYQVGTIGCIKDYVQKSIAFIFPLVGVVALIFLAFGGIRFILSGGEPKALESAKKTITYALLGLAVIFSIFLIFGILATMTGIDLLKIFEVVYVP